jgi:hypothetical protein
VILPAAKLHDPIWKYDRKVLADDLSAHLVTGSAQLPRCNCCADRRQNGGVVANSVAEVASSWPPLPRQLAECRSERHIGTPIGDSGDAQLRHVGQLLLAQSDSGLLWLLLCMESSSAS